MPLYLLWSCSHYNKKTEWIQGHIEGEITDLEFENHKSVTKMYFPHPQTSWGKYMFIGITKLKFQDRSELVRLRGKIC